MKSFFALTVVAMLAVASSTNIGNKNVITDIIENIINNNRDKLANLQIPLIDLGEFGTVTDLVITNAENFVLERLDAAGPLSVDIKNATITLEVGNAAANINAINVQVPEIGLTVNGVGSLTGSASTLRLTVALDLSLNGLTPVLEDFSSLAINVGAIDATLVGVDDADNVNAIINSKLAAFLTANLPTIAEENKPAIIAAINEVLGGLTH